MLFCLSQRPLRKTEGWKAGRMEGRGRRQKAEDRSQKSEVRIQKAEDRRQEMGWRVGKGRGLEG